MGTESAQTHGKRTAHVVLLASPGVSHVLPELARRIVAHGGGGEFTATLVTYANFSSADGHFATLASLPPSVSIDVLPEVPLDDLPADARVETRIFTVAKRALPQLRTLSSSSPSSPPRPASPRLSRSPEPPRSAHGRSSLRRSILECQPIVLISCECLYTRYTSIGAAPNDLVYRAIVNRRRWIVDRFCRNRTETTSPTPPGSRSIIQGDAETGTKVLEH
ncbi:unnamed protein product [Urochloa humidicola]